tara:strand:- start:3735 stop:4403 length:669 start_codon:yes stop_codon:yes gene_type:complete
MKKLITLLLVLVTLNGYSQKTYPDSIIERLRVKTNYEYPDSVLHYYYQITNYRSSFKYPTKRVRPKKWLHDVDIFIVGDVSDSIMNDITQYVKTMNELLDSIEVKLVSERKGCDILVYFGSGEGYMEYSGNRTIKNYYHLCNGLNWVPGWSGYIYQAEAFINLENTESQKRTKHVMYEEITQCFGLIADSYDYKNSIFYEHYNDLSELSELDKAIIKIHYNY